jgi:hypothetical protein
MVRRGSQGSDALGMRKASRLKFGIWAGVFCVGLPFPQQVMAPNGALLGRISHKAANAQTQSQSVEIVIPASIRVPTATESALRIDLSPRSAIPDRSILLIKGLPSTISLSHGRLFESGVWAVPVAQLGDLRLISGSALLSKADFTVSLVTFAGNVLAEGGSSLAVVRSGQPLETTAAVHQADIPNPEAERPKPQVAAPRLIPEPPSGKTLESVVLYMQKGDEFMKIGNISAARGFYTQAADLGWAEGALAVGTTYDPLELARLRVMGGIQADASQAKRWYEKAAELGSVQAQARLSALSKR